MHSLTLTLALALALVQEILWMGLFLFRLWAGLGSAERSGWVEVREKMVKGGKRRTRG